MSVLKLKAKTERTEEWEADKLVGPAEECESSRPKSSLPRRAVQLYRNYIEGCRLVRSSFVWNLSKTCALMTSSCAHLGSYSYWDRLESTAHCGSPPAHATTRPLVTLRRKSGAVRVCRRGRMLPRQLHIYPARCLSLIRYTP